jgi:ribosomal protein L34E
MSRSSAVIDETMPVCIHCGRLLKPVSSRRQEKMRRDGSSARTLRRAKAWL